MPARTVDPCDAVRRTVAGSQLNGLRRISAHLGGDLGEWSRSLSAVLGVGVQVRGIDEPRPTNAKAHGMTDTLAVSAVLADGSPARLYLKTPDESLYAETLVSDRLREVAWRLEGYPNIPGHVTCAATAWIAPDGTLRPVELSLDGCCLVEWEAPGRPYHERLADLDAEPAESCRAAVDALCDYLVGLHRPVPGEQRRLYDRMLRDTLMNAVFRLIDGASDYWDGRPVERREIERRFVEWRAALSRRSNRLRRTHNDFHPWNILFDGGRITVIGARVPGMGDPAEDLAALLVNYLWFGLRRRGGLGGAYRDAFVRLWSRYRRLTGDDECETVFAPFFAKRLLVLINPVYYPDQPSALVNALTALAVAVLRGEINALGDPDSLARFTAPAAVPDRVGS